MFIKRKIVLLLSGATILIFANSCFLTRKTIIYELPSNYSGRLVIEFDCKDAPNLKTDNKGNLIINVDTTGRVITSFPYLKFTEYGSEKYHWKGEEENHSIQLNSSSRIGSSWSGGREKPPKRTVIANGKDDTTVIYSGEEEIKLQYYCTYVFKSADKAFKDKIIDSLRLNKCDCDKYTEQYPYDRRCDK